MAKPSRRARQRARKQVPVTTNPDTSEMIDQTAEAVRESVAPLADMVIRNAVGAELRRAYDNAMSDLIVLADERRAEAWTQLRPQRLIKVVQGEIDS